MVNFPVSFDDDTTLFVAVNNLRTQLTSSIDASTLTIPVTSTTGFPSTGFISILTGTDITLTEAIKYTSLTSTQFNASERGAGGTTAATHQINDNVDFTIVASHHNELKDAVLELEQFVGVSGSENFLRINDSGNVFIPGTLNVDGSVGLAGDLVVSGTGAFTTSLTISGVPVSTGTSIFPRKGFVSFTTPVAAGSGGTVSDDESFNNRSLVRKTKVTPAEAGVDSYLVEFFKDSTLSADKLEYQATGSGTFIDNDVWFHEDEDQLFEIHYKLTNNSVTDSTFTVELTAEEFA